MPTIDAQPNPEYLIKSISEQGYSLETALSDLIDNSISADANNIEILTENTASNTSIFITDNGFGMSMSELKENMQFPSKDMEFNRHVNDLGRFGLGLKTASFSQTRKFTVISKKRNTEVYSALTWDVAHLKATGKWQIIVNTKQEIDNILNRYTKTSSNHLEEFNNYIPSTIIVWEELKNFKNFLTDDERINFLNEELTTTTSEYLSVVFHKFMESKKSPLKIRLNNAIVIPFNPFISKSGISARSLEKRELLLEKDVLKLEGFVLPVTANDNTNNWTTTNKSLLDMEGLYIYRGNRIIFFGGWNNIIRKQTKLKLARLKIQVGNMNDERLQLNVAKSKISIPYELKMGVLRYVSDLKANAVKEYNNRGLKSYNKKKNENKTEISLLSKQITTKGPLYAINKNYPLVKLISENLNEDQLKYFKTFLKSINLVINKQRYTDDNYVEIIEDNVELEIIISTTKKLLATGLSKNDVFNILLKDFGFQIQNLPEELKKIMK